MGTFSDGSARLPLSESPFGIPVGVGTSATLIHSCSNAGLEEVYIWAHDYAASSTEITMSFTFAGSGGSFGATDTVIAPLTSQNGLYLVYPGVPHKGCEIYAKAAAGSSVNVVGFVMRHYPIDLANVASGYNGST
jgi:hypothetical protein